MEATHIFEAGQPVEPMSESIPPAEWDLLGLSKASFNDLIEALKASPEHGPHEEIIPDRAIQIADLILDKTVSFIRLGTPIEIADAGVELSEMLIKPPEEERTGGLANEEAVRLIEAASTIIGAANKGSSGYEVNMLRKRDDGEWPLPTKMLAAIYEVADEKTATGEDAWVTTEELSDALRDHNEELKQWSRFDLEGQGLITSMREHADSLPIYHVLNNVRLPHVQGILEAYNRDKDQ